MGNWNAQFSTLFWTPTVLPVSFNTSRNRSLKSERISSSVASKMCCVARKTRSGTPLTTTTMRTEPSSGKVSHGFVLKAFTSSTALPGKAPLPGSAQTLTAQTPQVHFQSFLGACAAEGASAATREKPVSHGTTSCAQGATLGFSASPRDPLFSPVSLRCLLPRRLLAPGSKARPPN
jgi:hypothetical protein